MASNFKPGDRVVIVAMDSKAYGTHGTVATPLFTGFRRRFEGGADGVIDGHIVDLDGWPQFVSVPGSSKPMRPFFRPSEMKKIEGESDPLLSMVGTEQLKEAA